MLKQNHLTKVQRGIISNVLQTRYAEKEREAALRPSDFSEVELAGEHMQTDAFNALTAAMDRIHSPNFGLCTDCKEPIPFERLRAEPATLRCLACETIFEARRV